MQFANSTQIDLELGLSVPFAADSIVQDVYQTPAALRETLGDLARLKYQIARIKGKVTTSADDPNCVLTVRLNDGVNDLAAIDVALSGGKTAYFSREGLDLSAVSGAAQLRAIVDVKTAAATGVTAQLAVGLTVTHPVVLVGTC